MMVNNITYQTSDRFVQFYTVFESLKKQFLNMAMDVAQALNNVIGIILYFKFKILIRPLENVLKYQRDRYLNRSGSYPPRRRIIPPVEALTYILYILLIWQRRRRARG